jgi:hypothetical protein
MKRLVHIGRLILAMLREIFDEAAYARFLIRTNALASRQSYAAFCRERDATESRRPRCC